MFKKLKNHMFKLALSKTRVLLVLGVLCMFNSLQTNAQGYNVIYQDFVDVQSAVLTEDGGAIIAGRYNPDTWVLGIGDNVYINKLDADGEIEWSYIYGDNNLDVPNKIIELSDGSYLVAGQTNTSDDPDDTTANGYLLKVDHFGNEIWSESLGDGSQPDKFRSVVEMDNGNILAMGVFDFVGGCENCAELNQLWLHQVNSDGVYVNSTLIPVEDADGNVVQSQGYDISRAADGGYFISGVASVVGLDTAVSNHKYDLMVAKIAADGFTLQMSAVVSIKNALGEEDPNLDERIMDHIQMPDGSWLLVGFVTNETTGLKQPFHLKTYPDGSIDDGSPIYVYDEVHNGYASNIAIHPDGNYVMLSSEDDQINFHQVTFRKLDATTLATLEMAQIGGAFQRELTNELLISENKIQTFGSSQLMVYDPIEDVIEPANNFAMNSTLDLEFNTLYNYIVGSIFDDVNGDGELDAGESSIGVANWHVSATNGTTSFHGVTKEDGSYSLLVEEGADYVITATPPNNYWSSQSYSGVSTFGFMDSTSVDIAVEKEYDCADVEVDISTPVLIACQEATYSVNYCNHGTITSTPTFVSIEIDPLLSILDLPVGYTQDGNIYTYELGPMAFGQCGSFDFQVDVPCDTEFLNRTHTCTITASPDEVCDADLALWDGSDLIAWAECLPNDSLQFSIKNIGLDMDGPSYFVITEDALILMTIPIELGADSTMNIRFEPNGKTMRLEVAQNENYPGLSRPTVTLEACGTNVAGGFSEGMVNILPEDDRDHFVSIDAQQNVSGIATYNMNAFPTGVGADHWINANEDIEYNVYFRNILEEDVFQVVIRDTLPEELDISSVRVGASSHPFEYEIVNKRVLKFTFHDINLMPAGSSSENSEGFLKFRVSQKNNLAEGTLITNRAAIYYDDKAREITNLYYHNVLQPTVHKAVNLDLCKNVYFNEQLFENDTIAFDTLNFVHYDSIVIANITVQENYFSSVEVELQVGDIYRGVEYNEVADIYFIEYLTAENGCDSIIATDITVLLDIEEALPFLSKPEIFPVPTFGDISISYELTERTFVSVSIMNTLGQEVFQKAGEQQSSGIQRLEIPSSVLSVGTYMLSLKTDQGTYTEKIIKLE